MKPSFKTTSLVAAIGMSLAAGFSLTALFIGSFTNIDLYVHPVRMQALWRLHDAVWWASALVFFWGIFRYPDQLPELNKWSKRIAFAVVGSIAVLYFNGLFYTSFSDPLWLKITRYTLRFAANSIYVTALWWCFAKSAARNAGAMRNVSLLAALMCGVAVIYIAAASIIWWYNLLLPTGYYWYNTMFNGIIYIVAMACALIGIYPHETSPIVTNEKQKQIKRVATAGWIMLAAFLLNAALLGMAVVRSFTPEWLEIALMLSFFAIPAVAAIYLFIACRALQKAYDIIKEQN